ncbi:MAG: PKD domain-containing protein [Thermoplasmata archaeon]|nr:PKD domain-containing protein [Thermoplasmata archaeon]
MSRQSILSTVFSFLLVATSCLAFPSSSVFMVERDTTSSWMENSSFSLNVEMFVYNGSAWTDTVEKTVGTDLEFKVVVSDATGSYLMVTVVLPGLLEYTGEAFPPPQNVTENEYGSSNLYWYYDDGGGSRTFLYHAVVRDNGTAYSTVSAILLYPLPENVADSVRVNGTRLPTADAGGPYNVTVGEKVFFNGSLSVDNDEGGCCILRYDWRFYENDTWHNDTGPTQVHVYQEPGNYSVTLRVWDDEGETGNDTTNVTVRATDELMVYAHGPYSGLVGEPVQFYGSAYGGTPPYSWSWDFGDGGSSNEQNPSHVYTVAGSYTVVLTVVDSEHRVAYDSADVDVSENDVVPPDVEIVKPVDAVYLWNNRLFSFFVPVVIGDVDVKADASDADGVDRVEFYVDGALKSVDYEKPFVWRWSEKTFGQHDVRVVAYDNAGNSATTEMSVWKFF